MEMTHPRPLGINFVFYCRLVHVYDGFVELLLAGGLLGFADLLAVFVSLFESHLALLELLALALVEASVALLQHFGQG